MRKWLLAKWDALVYRLAFKSLQRRLINNPGLAYLFELNLREYRRENPLPYELQYETEKFFYAALDIAEDLRKL